MHAPSLIAYLILGLSLIVHPAPTSTTVNDISGQLDDLDITRTTPVPDWAVENGESKTVRYDGNDIYGPFVCRVRFGNEEPDRPRTAAEADVPSDLEGLIQKHSLSFGLRSKESPPLEIQFLSPWPWPKLTGSRRAGPTSLLPPQYNVRYYGYLKGSYSLVPASMGTTRSYTPRRSRHPPAKSSSNGISRKRPQKSGKFRMDQMNLF
ncbi:hypothetical protein FB446DRAFT_818065 [Lentinula raphanica]|nr:hypothetical protein C8R42DRAFT_674361 [Lentinula raphanica]KAJ3768093.1 hypothetical protein FB446DRAFT_818065 [Lentinula raphanica]